MASKNFTKGTPDQLINAIEKRIKMLSNSVEDIAASTDIDKIEWSKLADAVVEELLDDALWTTYTFRVDHILFNVYEDAGRRKLVDQYKFYPDAHTVEDEPLVNQAYHVVNQIKMDIEDNQMDVNAASTIVDTQTYANRLVKEISKVLSSRGINDIEFRIEPTQDVIYAYQSAVNDAGEHTVVEYSIPFADLHMASLDDMDTDVNYVVDSIETEGNATLEADASSVTASKSFEDSDGDIWYMVDQKRVRDSDGFMTDYTMYRNEDKSRYIFMFGDADIYEPDPTYADWEVDSEAEAHEWFESYTGFDDEDEEDDTGFDFD